MLPPMSLPMPATWRDLLEELAPVFARRSTHRLFAALACGMILADRSTVVAMAAAGGMAGKWRRACWFFSGAVWDIGHLGLAVAQLVVKYLAGEGEPVVVACDGTFFKRWGRKVFRCHRRTLLLAVGDRAVECDRKADPRSRRRLQPGREGRRAHRPVRVPHPVPAGLLVRPQCLQPRRHRPAAPAVPVVPHQDQPVSHRHARQAAPRVPQSQIFRHPARPGRQRSNRHGGLDLRQHRRLTRKHETLAKATKL